MSTEAIRQSALMYAQKDSRVRNCAYCGNVFAPYRQSDTQKFCSHRCYSDSRIRTAEECEQIAASRRTKKCAKCGEVLPASEFYPRKDSRTGRLTAYCKSCVAERRRQRDNRWYDIKHRYGLTRQDFDLLLRTQGGNCAICGKGLGAELHIDHDHTDGRVRGLLCLPCNHMLGWYERRAEFVKLAQTYLESPPYERSKERTTR